MGPQVNHRQGSCREEASGKGSCMELARNLATLNLRQDMHTLDSVYLCTSNHGYNDEWYGIHEGQWRLCTKGLRELHKVNPETFSSQDDLG